jgi:hypothetical protein
LIVEAVTIRSGVNVGADYAGLAGQATDGICSIAARTGLDGGIVIDKVIPLSNLPIESARLP